MLLYCSVVLQHLDSPTRDQNLLSSVLCEQTMWACPSTGLKSNLARQTWGNSCMDLLQVKVMASIRRPCVTGTPEMRFPAYKLTVFYWTMVLLSSCFIFPVFHQRKKKQHGKLYLWIRHLFQSTAINFHPNVIFMFNIVFQLFRWFFSPLSEKNQRCGVKTSKCG